MIDIELRLRNYRCFGDEPVSICFTDGFTALVGTNNSGKSSLLRMPYELRSLFSLLTNPHANPGQQLLRGGNSQGRWTPSVASGERIFRTGADRPVEIDIVVRDGPKGRFAQDGDQVVLTITYDRQGFTNTILKTEGGTVLGSMEQPLDLSKPGALDLEPFTSAMQQLVQSMYIGPFRNAINVGGQDSYYDIQVGEQFIRSFSGFKSGPMPEQNEAVYELTQEIKRIFGFESLDTLTLSATINPFNLPLTVEATGLRNREQGSRTL
jgi:hypothetical protein